MKILLVVDDYLPYSTKVGAKMMHELACELLTYSHIVSVLTPNVSMKENFKITKIEGVDVCTFKSGEIKNVAKIKRAFNETLLSYNAWRYGEKFFLENKHDLIVYYSPTIFFGPLIKRLKKLWNVPSYLILRDIFPQWTIDNGMLNEGSLITRYFQYFERINYTVADTIGVMSTKNLEWFNGHYESQTPVEVLHNWSKIERPKVVESNYREILHLEEKIVYFYGGNLGHAQDMMNIVRLAKGMKQNKEAHFLLVGAGDEYSLLETTIQREHITNMTLLPSVNQTEYLKMLQEFDIGLFTLSKEHKTHNFPGKLLGYMLYEMPILGSVNIGNDLKELVQEYNAGYITINGDDKLLLLNAQLLLENNLRKRMGKDAKILLEKQFSVQSAAEQILKQDYKS